jgi:O-antigen/teichoic acid export membrane protein
MLQILIVGVWFATMGAANSAVTLALGRSDWTAVMAVGKVVGVVTFISLGYSFLGFPGAVLGVAGGAATEYVVSVFLAKVLGFDGRLTDLRFSVRVAISGVAGWFAVRWVTSADFDNALLHALVIFVVVTAFWARPLLAFLRRARRGKPIFRKGEPSPAA